MTSTNLRNAGLATLAGALKDQQTRALDVVVPARQITVDGGAFVVRGTEQVLTADGVTTTDGLYLPTSVGEEGVSSKLDIPLRYLRRMRNEGALDLYDENVNGWLSRSESSYLLRLLKSDTGNGFGTLRAFLSDSYRTIDNFDVLLASLQGIRAAGVESPRITADLTDRRMYVKVVAEQVKAYAPNLLAGYRSPFTGQTGTDNPTVFAGFVVSNSETGGGAFSITPRIEVQVCSNGMTIGKAVREVHIGGKLDEGVIRWSQETIDANLELIKGKAKDAVSTFLDVDYVTGELSKMEAAAGVKVTDPQKTVTEVSRRLGFTQEQASTILNMFIDGGQRTAGGVMQAITATAQTLDSGDDADEFERKALPALELAASLR